MNRDSLNKAIDSAKFSYYESIAKLIVENPAVKLADLRRQYGISHHEMWKAQEMFHVRRGRGKDRKLTKEVFRKRRLAIAFYRGRVRRRIQTRLRGWLAHTSPAYQLNLTATLSVLSVKFRMTKQV